MNFTKKIWESVVTVWFFLRFLLPLVVFVNPIAGQVISMTLDGPDGYFTFKAKKPWQWYHKWDKLADYWWYVLILVYSFAANLPILPSIIFLFIYRTMGQFITLKKKESWMLIFFPNILENYFIAYLIFGVKMLDTPLSTYVWVICIAIAIFREYLLHIKKAYAVNYIFKLGVDWNKNKK